MGSVFLIILCTTLFINVSVESKTEKNDRKYKIFLQKMQNEGYIKTAKRSVSRMNEVGGSNDNGIIMTTTETNVIQYSAPHLDPAHQVNLKLITTTTSAESENVKVASSNNSESDSLKNTVIGTYNETQNNETAAAEVSLDEPVNDINSSFTSDNNSVDEHNVTAIAGSAILASNDSGAILSEHSLSNVLSQSINDKSDVFATPVTATRENAGQVNTSHVSNIIAGNTTTAEVANKMNNSIPQVTDGNLVNNAIVQTTQDSINSASSESTFLPKNEETSNITLPLSLQTTISPESSQTLAPEPSMSQPDNSSDGNSLERQTTTLASNKSRNDDSENLNQTLTSALVVSTTPEAIITTSSNTTGEETLPENEMGELENTTLSNLPESEPEPQAEPVPKSENNTDIITDNPVNTTTVTAVLNNTKTTLGSLINTTKEQVTFQTTKSVGNTTSFPENISEPSLNETVKGRTDELKPGGTATTSVTPVAVTPNSEMPNATSDKPEGNITSTRYSTNSKSTEQQNQLTTESISTNSSFAEMNITSSAEPEGQVTAEPADKMTQEPKENNTFSKTVTENTAVISPGENTTAIYQVTTTNKMPVSSQKASVDSVTTTPKPSDKKTTTVTNTVEPSSEPEDYSPSKHGHTDISTQSTPRNPIQETTTNIINDEEGEAESESENSDPEPEKEQEPENEPDQFNSDTFAEPGPDWELAKASWKEAWEFHVYFFGIAFALLGVYCLLTLIRLWNMEHMLSKHYFITLHLLVILVCILRTTYLMIDAYNSLGTFPYAVDYFLYSTAFPCLTALFSILFYALLLATRVQVISKKVQKLWVLVVIIAFHFILSIATDIVVGLFMSASVMTFICQAFFVLWGSLMFVGYLVIFRKLYKGAIYRKKNLMSTHFEHKNNSTNVSTKQKFTLGLAVKVTLISALFGVAYIGFELYGMFGVYGVLKSRTKPEPWPWWTYHTIVRSLEVFMCLTVAYVASQPLRYRMNKNVDHKIYHYLLPCSICCCPDNIDQNDIYNSSISLDYVISETDHLSWLKKMKNKKTPSPEAPYPPHTAEKYADPDATLLVRKVRRSSKPSMLVVEDGFVRIRREDEMLPSNQYELDSGSSHSSDSNDRPDVQSTPAVTSVINRNYAGGSTRSNSKNETGVNFNDYILQRNVANRQMTNNEESDEDTDIDIVVTESEHEDDNRPSPGGVNSNKSDDLFRPLSMIDLATSIESELDRAFNSSCVEEIDLISHNSLPISFDGYNTESNGCAYNERLCDKYGDNINDSTQYSSDSADDQSKSSAARLLQPTVRRCKSDDSKSSSQKFKNFERNRYFSVSGVDSISKDDEVNTHFGSNGELRTDL